MQNLNGYKLHGELVIYQSQLDDEDIHQVIDTPIKSITPPSTPLLPYSLS